MSEVMVSKLLPPRLREDLVERPRLMQLLSQVKLRKITLITAPAGYGKTTAMMQFANIIPKPVIWYQLDQYDNDPVVFMQYLMTGIQQILPEFGKKLLPLIKQVNIDSHLRILVTAMVNVLTTTALGVMVAFDDFHVITNPTVLKFMQELLEHLPSNIQMIITSRAVPALSLTRLDLAGEVALIGVEELRFNYQEICSFLSNKEGVFSEEYIKELEDKTAGWPAALRFAGASKIIDSKLLSPLKTTEIYNYLTTEIFDQQPEEIRQFLLYTSVLETITPGNCDQLLNRNDSSRILNRLDKAQLFLIPLNSKDVAYKYHQLFREFLQERLGPERNSILHRAAEMAIQKEEWDSAIEYLSMANSTDKLMAILQTAGKQAFQRGRWQTVSRWLELLTREQIAANNWLSLFQAKVEIYLGRLDEAEIWITKANAGFIKAQEGVGLAESQVLQARLLRCRGRYEESIELIEKASNYLQQNETSSRFDLVLEKYLIFLMTGKFKAAEELLNNALQTAEQEHDGLIVAYLLEGLGNIYYLQGDYYKALQIYKKGEALSPDRVLPSYYTQDNIAAIYQEWGELDKAFEYAKRNVAIKESFGATEALPSAYYQLAVIYMDYGEFKKAEEYFNKAIDLIKVNNGELFYLTLNKIFLARCLSLEGRMIESLVKAKEALAEAHRQSGLILAICKELYASIIVQLGNIWEAERLLKEVSVTFKEMGFQRALCFSYSGLAFSKFLKHNLKEAGKFARLSLELCSRKNFIQSYITLFNPAQPILRYGLEQGIEITFIHQVIVRRGTQAILFLNKLASHPSPEVRTRIILPLAEIGGPKAYSLIIKLTKDKDSGVRELAQLTAQRLNLYIDPVFSGEPETAPIMIKTFGVFGVLDDRKQYVINSWRTTKARDLLAYFIHQNEPVTIDRIIEDFWPEMSTEKAANNFHTTLYQLRQALFPKYNRDFICYSNKRYYLPPNTFLTDRQNFEELAAKGLDGKPSPEKIDYLKKALDIYGGDYLVELDYAWVLPVQEYLKQLHQEIHLHLSRYYLEVKEYHQSIHHLRRLIELNPFSEEFYQLLMSAYAGLGNRAAIKELYRQMVQTLKDELGLEPDPETKEFYRKLTGAVKSLTSGSEG